MSAREEMFEAMAGSWSLTASEAEGVNRIIDAFMHGLAEEQRAWARKHGLDTVTVTDVINLIDPQATA